MRSCTFLIMPEKEKNPPVSMDIYILQNCLQKSNSSLELTPEGCLQSWNKVEISNCDMDLNAPT